MISYVESNDTSISTGLKQHNNYFGEKLYSLSPIYLSRKKQTEDQVLKMEFRYVIGQCRHSLKVTYGLVNMISFDNFP
jgi:hypothetical protein